MRKDVNRNPKGRLRAMKLNVVLEVVGDLQKEKFAKGFKEKQDPISLLHESLCLAIHEGDANALTFLHNIVTNIAVSR